MRIVIDMQGAQTESSFRGIGRYTLSLVKAILENKSNKQEIYLVLNGNFPESINSIRSTFKELLPQENIRIWYSIPSEGTQEEGSQWRISLAKIMREYFIESLSPDIFLLTSLFEGYGDVAHTSINSYIKGSPTAVIFYDLIPLIYSKEYLDPNPIYAKFYNEKVEFLKHADILLAISNATAADGSRLLGVNPEKIKNISAGYDEKFKKINISESKCQTIFDKFDVKKPFILYTGGADFRKNISFLVEAFSKLTPDIRRSYQLVFAGKIPEAQVNNIKSIADKSGLNEDSFIFLGYVSDEHLVILYNLCNLFVFPSIYEGFGLPALEAMACGAPVITSNTSSLPEVVDNQNLMFNPASIDSLVKRISDILCDEDSRVRAKEYGIERAKQFSWDLVAKKVLSALTDYKKRSPRIKRIDSEQLVGILIEEVASLSTHYPEVNLHKLEIAKVIAQNHPELKRRNKLFVDVSELVHRDAKTGIQRVVRSILKQFLVSPPYSYEVVPVYGSLNVPGYRVANQFLKSFMGTNNSGEDRFIDIQPGDIFLGLDLQHHIVAAQSEYYQYLRRMGVKIYFVIYDLLPVLLPSSFPPGSYDAHLAWLREISKYDGVVCISKAVSDEFLEWAREVMLPNVKDLEVGWFHLGADIDNSSPTMGIPENANFIFQAMSIRKTFLMVGTIEPRKGYEYVLQEFVSLWNAGVDVNLVMVGKHGWAVEGLIKKITGNIEYEKRLFWLNDVTDEYLERVYKLSTCLIAGSYGEGFGLPLIESAQNGLPIIARSIPVFKEIAAEGAHYFVGNASGDLVRSIEEWLKLHSENLHPKSTDINWITWKESAQQLKMALSLT
jgi:glycosyltransferase involved in cell wall biosynthesis